MNTTRHVRKKMPPPCILSIVCIVVLKTGIALLRWFVHRYWPGRFVLVLFPSGERCVGKQTKGQQLIRCCQNVAGCVGGRVAVCAVSFFQSYGLSLIREWMKKMTIWVMNAVCWIFRKHFGAVIMGVGLALQVGRMDEVYSFFRW